MYIGVVVDSVILTARGFYLPNHHHNANHHKLKPHQPNGWQRHKHNPNPATRHKRGNVYESSASLYESTKADNKVIKAKCKTARAT